MTWWIRQAVTRAIVEKGRSIRVPVHMVEEINKVSKARRLLAIELGHEPSLEELSKELQIPVKQIEEILHISEDAKSLDTPVGEDGDSILQDIQQYKSSLPLSTLEELEQLRSICDKELSELTEREQKIISMRFGLNGEEPKTLEETGKEFGVTREHIRQIEEKLRKRLHIRFQNQDLELFLYRSNDDYENGHKT